MKIDSKKQEEFVSDSEARIVHWAIDCNFETPPQGLMIAVLAELRTMYETGYRHCNERWEREMIDVVNKTEALNNEVSEYALPSGWVSTSDDNPPDGVEVLMFDGFDYRIGTCHRYSSPRVGIEWFDSHDQDWQGKPTHWMALPRKPNETLKNGIRSC